jgi:lipoic acid synthetase
MRSKTTPKQFTKATEAGVAQTTARLPEWFKQKISKREQGEEIRKILQEDQIHTVCEEAKCPNRGECFKNKTVTFMILGDTCTRTCGFCAVKAGKPMAINPHEPEQVAKAVSRLGLKHAVITSVNRDDLKDGGAKHFADVIHAVRLFNPLVTIEVLTPDFKGNLEALKMIIDAKPNVFNHNIETIEDFYPFVRPQANYQQSLTVLNEAKNMGARRAASEFMTKSGIMLGFGETEEQVVQVMKDLRTHQVEMMTLGQYLRPSKDQLPVKEYITPEQFKRYEVLGFELGFKFVFSGPLIRSSYHAGEFVG